MKILHSKGKRFYMKTANGEAELSYRINDRVMSVYHTFVPEEERGKGIAEMLAMKAFDYAIEKKLRLRPDCPYISHFLEKHTELKRYSV